MINPKKIKEKALALCESMLKRGDFEQGTHGIINENLGYYSSSTGPLSYFIIKFDGVELQLNNGEIREVTIANNGGWHAYKELNLDKWLESVEKELKSVKAPAKKKLIVPRFIEQNGIKYKRVD